MKGLYLILWVLACPLVLAGQYNETIRSGRPGQAIGPFTLGAKVLQVQSGLNFNRINFDGTEIESVSSNTVIRYGIWERFEISGVINGQDEQIVSNGQQLSRSGISDTQFGGRINVLDNDGVVPAVCLQGRLLLTFVSNDFERENLGSNFIIATANQVTDRLSLITNFGLVWSGNGGDPRSFYVLNVSYSMTDRLGVFADMYGDLDGFTTNFDGGFSYLVNNDLQLDASAAWQDQVGVSDWYVDVGVSWRVDWRD